MLEFIVFHLIIMPLAISMAAGVWSEVLTQGDHVFSFVRKIAMPELLSKPLYGCWICVSGQWAMWFQIICFWVDDWTLHPFNIFISTIGILVTMFMSWQVSKIQSHF